MELYSPFVNNEIIFKKIHCYFLSEVYLHFITNSKLGMKAVPGVKWKKVMKMNPSLTKIEDFCLISITFQNIRILNWSRIAARVQIKQSKTSTKHIY